MSHAGRCLCGQLRYEATTPPLGGDGLLLYLLSARDRGAGHDRADLRDQRLPLHRKYGKALHRKRYTDVSAGSGQEVYVHFCAACGTKTHLTFARWPERLGVCAGTFEDPGWFAFTPENSKVIFVDDAARGTLVSAGFRTFAQHATTADCTPLDPLILDEVFHLR